MQTCTARCGHSQCCTSETDRQGSRSVKSLLLTVEHAAPTAEIDGNKFWSDQKVGDALDLGFQQKQSNSCLFKLYVCTTHEVYDIQPPGSSTTESDMQPQREILKCHLLLFN